MHMTMSLLYIDDLAMNTVYTLDKTLCVYAVIYIYSDLYGVPV